MIRVFSIDEAGVHKTEMQQFGPLPANWTWLDLHMPTRDDERAVEAALGIDVPTREEMKEIEASSRLRQEGETVYMTATVIAKAETDQPETSAITFILATGRLVTLRYADPQPFRTFGTYAERHAHACASGEAAFAGLVEAIVDRLADILEVVGVGVDALSKEVFSTGPTSRARDFRELMGRIGRYGDLTTKVRESLVSLSRILLFSRQALVTKKQKKIEGRFKNLGRDVSSLSDHVTFLSNKVNFVLDATLGMINIEQNAIIKIFSVAAVVFLPPTLVASIYGMNFHFMPELDWPFGYPLALVLMVISGILPYVYFKRRGWL